MTNLVISLDPTIPSPIYIEYQNPSTSGNVISGQITDSTPFTLNVISECLIRFTRANRGAISGTTLLQQENKLPAPGAGLNTYICSPGTYILARKV